MKILVTGTPERCAELKEKISGEHAVHIENSLLQTIAENYDLVFDLNLDDRPFPSVYNNKNAPVIIGCAVKKSLKQMMFDFNTPLQCKLFGMNALPTFIDRPKVEISTLETEDSAPLTELMKVLGWDYLQVEDRVGMVTPRVVCMLINEACFTLQEGTASLEDMDKAMKLGANYPYGPFEWCDLIGIKDVYETLDAIWNDAHDERHRICPLLKRKYMNREKFYRLL